MSPIGRVFIVINLILAGAFVAMAGTFLQQHTDYKAQYDAKVDELAAANARFDAERNELSDKIQKQDVEVRRITSTLESSSTENAALKDENQRLTAQLADLSADIKSINSRSATMSEAIDRAAADSKMALDRAIEAAEAKQAALNAKEAAETELSGAKRRLDDLETKLADAMANVASLEESNKEKDMIIAFVRVKAPGIIDNAQPDLRGIVERAQGNICTVRVTENPGDAEIKPGYQFALYKGSTYKGEAVITEVDGEHAFCRIIGTEAGMTVAAGDAAATNTN